MKNFNEYLTESAKTYPFRIKVAGDLPENFSKNLKSMLEKFSCKKLSTASKTPIQEVPLDFPELKNMEVSIFEAELCYPTTTAELTNYISTGLAVPQSHLKIRSPFEPTEEYQEDMQEVEKEKREALLNQDYEKSPKESQAQVGQKRAMNLIKELSKIKHGGEQYKGVNDELLATKAAPKSQPTNTSDNAEGTVSPVGSKKTSA